MAGVVGADFEVGVDHDRLVDIDSNYYEKDSETPKKQGSTRFLPFFMHALIMSDVKKLVSPFRSTVILRKSSSRIGQMALVGC